MYVEQTIVTPGLAKQMLGDNHHLNRRLSHSHVCELAHKMRTGKWTDSSDLIAFDRAGRLVNGQHRLSAVVMSNTNQQIFIAKDMAPDAMGIMDTQKSRTQIDRLTMSGEKIAGVGIQVCRALIDMKTRVVGARENESVMSCYELYRPELEQVASLRGKQIPVAAKAAMVLALKRGEIDFLRLKEFPRAMSFPEDKSEWAAMAFKKFYENAQKHTVGRNHMFLAAKLCIKNFAKGKGRRFIKDSLLEEFKADWELGKADTLGVRSRVG